jgi:hypothetical protein
VKEKEITMKSLSRVHAAVVLGGINAAAAVSICEASEDRYVNPISANERPGLSQMLAQNVATPTATGGPTVPDGDTQKAGNILQVLCHQADPNAYHAQITKDVSDILNPIPAESVVAFLKAYGSDSDSLLACKDPAAAEKARLDIMRIGKDPAAAEMARRLGTMKIANNVIANSVTANSGDDGITVNIGGGGGRVMDVMPQLWNIQF